MMKRKAEDSIDPTGIDAPRKKAAAEAEEKYNEYQFRAGIFDQDALSKFAKEYSESKP